MRPLSLAALILTLAMSTFATPQDVSDEYTSEYVAELATGADDFDPADATDAVSVKVQKQLDRFGAKLDAAVRARYGDDHGYDGSNELLNGMAAQGAFLYLMEKSRGGLDDKATESLERLDKDVTRIASGALSLETGDQAGGSDDLEGETFRGRQRLFARPDVQWSLDRVALDRA